MKWLSRALGLLALALSGHAAAASCSMVVANGSTLMDFGQYSALGGAVDRSAMLTLVCAPDLGSSLTVSYSMAIDAGVGSGGQFLPRRLAAGGHGLSYNLYRDPSRTLVWGDGTAGTSRQTGSCASTCALTVYGRLFGGQSAPAATYADAVVITVDY